MPVTENDEVKLTWDMTTYTDKKLKHNRPDITVLLKEENERNFIYIAVPADQNIIKTQNEKIERYQKLAFELKRINQASKLSVIPIVTGAVGIILKDARTWKGKLRIPDDVGSAQLSAILGTAHILRKVLCP